MSTNSDLILRRVVVTPFVENVYIVGSLAAKECIVVDPGAQPERILYEVNHLDLKVKLIINTHGHGDHTSAVAGVKAGTDAPYAIHQADVPLLKDKSAWLLQAVPDYQPPPEPDKFLQDGDVLQVGKLRFQVLETPGHTLGGVCLHGHGLVFTGDTLFRQSIGRFDTHGGNGRQLIDSIFAKLLTLPDVTVVLPGHGMQSTIGEEKRSNPFLQGDMGFLQ